MMGDGDMLKRAFDLISDEDIERAERRWFFGEGGGKGTVRKCGGLIDYINSRPGWNAFQAEEIQTIGPDAGQPVDVPFIGKVPPFDPIPVTVVTLYPFCDCGEPALEEKVLMCKDLSMYGYGYMNTCYECQV
ncbi:MAG: hypothetical protein KAS32_15800, partial [Candidatus Peribacteraceae bacterium]|nr:hypothetical protein [Candidatus Peribacteraceae bacterium]